MYAKRAFPYNKHQEIIPLRMKLRSFIQEGIQFYLWPDNVLPLQVKQTKKIS